MKIETGINPKYIKIAIWIVVAVAVFFILKRVWKWFKEYRDRKKIEETLGGEIVPSDLSYSEAEYVVLAENLYGALNDKKSGWRGVNQEAVYEVFKKIKTASDLLKLNDAFGVRTFDFAWTSRAEDGDYTLLEIMRSRVLTDGEKAKIREILAENGVKFTW